ncbi:MAG: DUF4058 family protein [Planctomycetales bacterium]
MPSPFPGMDPYLEDPEIWMDFHESFVTYCRDALIAQLPDGYDARIEERVSLVRVAEEEAQRFRADVGISVAPGRARPAPTPSGTLLLEPVTIPLAVFEEASESRIHIVRRADRRLVTVIELLSPSNKSGDGAAQYRAKRDALCTTRVHLVEFDLLLGGDRLSLRRPLPPGDYYALVSRGDRRPNCDVFSWTVRDPLPTIMIPLESPDPDLPLDLAALFRTTYDRGRYDRTLRYGAPPPVLRDSQTAQWIQETAAQS